MQQSQRTGRLPGKELDLSPQDSALFRGLVILIPIVLVWITIRELVEIMIGFATPIADLFPAGWVLENDPVELIAAILIVGMALLLGMV